MNEKRQMKKENWTYQDRVEIPTVSELKDMVITLIPDNDFDYIGNAWSSGGFKVSLYYDEYNNPVCKIEFNK